MRRMMAGFAIAAAVAFAPTAAVGKTCGGGTKRATIDGATKCLRAGEFCKRGDNSQYRRYGYKCVTASDGRARLKRA